MAQVPVRLVQVLARLVLGPVPQARVQALQARALRRCRTQMQTEPLPQSR